MKQNKKVVKCSTFICKTKHFEMFQIYPACLLNPLALKAPSVSQTPSPPLSHVHTRTQSRTNNCFYPPKRCFVSAARSPTIWHLPQCSLLKQTPHDTLGCFHATVAMDVSQHPPHTYTPSLPSNNQLTCTTGLPLKSVLSRLKRWGLSCASMPAAQPRDSSDSWLPLTESETKVSNMLWHLPK